MGSGGGGGGFEEEEEEEEEDGDDDDDDDEEEEEEEKTENKRRAWTVPGLLLWPRAKTKTKQTAPLQRVAVSSPSRRRWRFPARLVPHFVNLYSLRSGWIGLDRVGLDFSGFYWVLPGFPGSYWVSLDFTGFHCV